MFKQLDFMTHKLRNVPIHLIGSLLLAIGLLTITFLSASAAQNTLEGSTDSRSILLPAATVNFTAFPKDLQLYPRDLNTNKATVSVAGTVTSAGHDEVILKISRHGTLSTTLTQPLSPTTTFNFMPEITAELVNYEFEVSIRTGVSTEVITQATNIVAGDVYLINGQSNAVARQRDDTSHGDLSNFVRSYGTTAAISTTVVAEDDWYEAVGDYLHTTATIGQWGLRFGRRLSGDQTIPIAILNGAEGAKAISHFQRNDADPDDLNTNYGRLLYRAQEAGVVNAVRGILWHQGETDGANLNYATEFEPLYHDWKADYSNLEHIYVHQIREDGTGTGDCGNPTVQMRDIQRRLGDMFADVSVMSTTGIDEHDGCHYGYLNGYQLMGDHIFRVVARDLYNSANTENIDPPNIASAHFSDATNSEITLVMRDTNDTLLWDAGSEAFFNLEGAAINVTTGAIDGNRIELTLSGDGSAATGISYEGHQGAGAWVKNGNGVGLLVFYNTELISNADYGDLPASYGIAWHTDDGSGLKLGSNRTNGTTFADNSDNSDDDGVAIDTLTNWNPGATTSISVTVSGGGGFLAAWFDWDNDGTFDDASEKMINQNVVSGTNNINIAIPGGAATSEAIRSRFRLYPSEPIRAPTATESPQDAAHGGEIEDYTIEPPLLVSLANLSATREKSGVMVRWETTLEQNLLGFNIYRSTTEQFVPDSPPLNSHLLPSQAPGSGQGSAYEWLDSNAEAKTTDFYWLEDVDLNGNKTRHGPVKANEYIPTAVTINQLSASEAESPWGTLQQIGLMLTMLPGLVATTFIMSL